jgi:hypothetical protein
MSGDKAEKLGAAVRDVRQAATLSGDAYRLFCAMGFKMQYQVMRRGLRYAAQSERRRLPGPAPCLGLCSGSRGTAALPVTGCW